MSYALQKAETQQTIKEANGLFMSFQLEEAIAVYSEIVEAVEPYREDKDGTNFAPIVFC